MLKPLADRVLVKPLEAEEKTSGGILLPDAAKQKPQRGRVISVGQGKRHEDGSVTPVSVHVGDEVVYGRYAGSDVNHDGKEYKILNSDDILAVVK